MLTTRKIADIKVDPKRFRTEYPNMNELKESIRFYGLIQPIVIDEEDNLIAGHRRLLCCQELGVSDAEISVNIISADFLRSKELEFEENKQRENFTWQEEASAISELHEIRTAVLGKAASGRGGGEGHSLAKMAEELKMSKTKVHDSLKLAEAMKTQPDLAKAKTKQEAMKQLVSNRAAELKAELLKRSTARLKDKPIKHHLFNEDCLDWMKNAEPNQFDIVLTDPPYGIDVELSLDTNTRFDDSAKTFNSLIEQAIIGIDRVTKPNAHIYIFHAPDGWKLIQEVMLNLGWSVDPKPLIWVKTDHQKNVLGGACRNADRRYAMAYEMCTFAVKGNKPLQKQGRPNVIIDEPVGSIKKIHPTEKPDWVLSQLLQNSALPGDLVFDPFGGSFATVEAAHRNNLTATACESDEIHFAVGLNRVANL